MSSLQDPVAQNRASGDARTDAENALLNTITKQVEELQKSQKGIDYIVSGLVQLAEAYALVVHGKKN
ncbi:hypothetical protein [Streptomyces sp. NPDC003688]